MMFLKIFREAVSIFNDLFDLCCNFPRKHGQFLMMFDDVLKNFREGVSIFNDFFRFVCNFSRRHDQILMILMIF